MKTTTRKEAAASARQRSESRFVWTCETHGETEHYSRSQGVCVKCCSERNRSDHAHRMATPEGREARRNHQRTRRSIPEVREAANAYLRRYDERRRAQDPAYLGASRERVTAHQWRKATGAKAMPAAYGAERAAIRRVYAECPDDYHVDHLTAKVAKDYQGNHIASGLHTLSNLKAVPGRLNMIKQSHFDSDNFRDQRPANAFPGGAWDPELTEEEWARVELLVRCYGHDRDETVQDVQAQIARQHARHLQSNAA